MLLLERERGGGESEGGLGFGLGKAEAGATFLTLLPEAVSLDWIAATHFMRSVAFWSSSSTIGTPYFA